jgi:hypothetical protein
MDELDNELSEQAWEAGFEGDRRVVVAQWGPFRRVFPRPKTFSRRFYHRVYDLAIDDWHLPLQAPDLGPLCQAQAALHIRFQATFRFAEEHLDQIGRLGQHIQSSYKTLLQDAAEQELRRLETPGWLDHGHDHLERRVENVVHELLAIRNIQSRARCRIETRLLDAEISADSPSLSGVKQSSVALELTRRRREEEEQLMRERYQMLVAEQTLKLEHEERMLELQERENRLRRLKQQREKEETEAELTAERMRHAAQVENDIKLQEDRIRHEARVRQLELEADVAEKALRAEAIDDVESHLRREIELLAMERHRLALEQEIHEVKVARAKGWVINAKRRFPLGDDSAKPQEAEIADDSVQAQER